MVLVGMKILWEEGRLQFAFKRWQGWAVSKVLWERILNVWSKIRESAKAMSLVFALLNCCNTLQYSTTLFCQCITIQYNFILSVPYITIPYNFILSLQYITVQYRKSLAHLLWFLAYRNWKLENYVVSAVVSVGIAWKCQMGTNCVCDRCKDRKWSDMWNEGWLKIFINWLQYCLVLSLFFIK